MANGTCFAVLLVGTDGRTYLVNANGIEVKRAIQAGKDAVVQLQQLSLTNDPGDISATGQGAPLLCGCVRLWAGGWQVHYRAMGSTLAMVVTPDGSNAFGVLNLLGAVVRIATQDGKVTEVSPDRLVRKQAEIYFALDALVGSIGVMGAGAAMSDARGALNVAAAGNSLSRRRAGGTVKYPVSQRTLAHQVDQLGSLTFSSSAALSGLRPPPGFALHPHALPHGDTAAAAPSKPALPTTTLMAAQDPFAQVPGSSAAPKPAAAAADPFEDIFGPITNAAMAPADADRAAAAAAAVKAAEGAAVAALVASVAPAEAATPAPPPAVPSCALLRLRECWRGECVGSAFVRASLDGEVVWADNAKEEPVPFSLKSTAWAGQGVAASLASASRHALATSVGTDLQGRVVADAQSAQLPQPPVLLRYHIPPGPGLVPPVCVRVSAVTAAISDDGMAFIVGVRVGLADREGLKLEGMSVSLALPALLGMPLRCAPGGAQLDVAAATLKWTLPAESCGPGCQAVMAAVFKVTADEAACTDAARALVADVELHGSPGGTSYSGVELEQACADSGAGVPTASWRAHVRAVPAR